LGHCSLRITGGLSPWLFCLRRLALNRSGLLAKYEALQLSGAGVGAVTFDHADAMAR